MTKLSKEKKERLILVVMGLGGLLLVLYTMVIGGQKDELLALNGKLAIVQDKLAKAERMVDNADTIETELTNLRAELKARQEFMAPQGQYYIWFFKLLDGFRQELRLEPNFIMDVTQPEIGTVGMLPKFPYNAGFFGVRVSGQFQEIGRFFAELENRYPYMRIQSVRLQPFAFDNTGTTAGVAPQNEAVAAAIKQPAPAVAGRSQGQKIIAEFKIVTLFNPGT